MVTPELKGAFTGGISAPMLKSIGVESVLAGHSERRTINMESDEYINAQCLKLIETDMNVILCIGETEAEYEQKLAGAVCAVQLKKGLKGVSKEDVMSHVTIACKFHHYTTRRVSLVSSSLIPFFSVPPIDEPVWAIGTGKVATPEIAQSVHATCRDILAEMYDQETADATRILYGGSVSPESVDELLAEPDIDGALVGGASLDAAKFGRIINFEVPTLQAA